MNKINRWRNTIICLFIFLISGCASMLDRTEKTPQKESSSISEPQGLQNNQATIMQNNGTKVVDTVDAEAEYMLIYKIIFLIPHEIGYISYDKSSLNFSVTGTIGGKNINIKETVPINENDLYNIRFFARKNAEVYLTIRIDNINIQSLDKGIWTDTSFTITQRPNEGTIAKWDNDSKIAFLLNSKITVDFRGETSKTNLENMSIDEKKEILSRYIGRKIP